MHGNKVNKFLLFSTIVSTLIMVIGATFSYFTISSRSKLNAIAVEAGNVRMGLGVSNFTSGILLIPMYDDDVMTAYHHNCIDDNGFGACNIFNFALSNFSDVKSVIGKINFEVNGIDNLNYIVLDDNDNVFLEKTSIPNGSSSNMSLGDSFSLNAGTEISPSVKNFKLVIWLSNKEEDQNDYDAGGTYTATVNYSAVDGSVLTGTIKGMV